MNLTFKKTGDITPFINWLELFKGEISGDSIIIEVDYDKKKFVTKGFTEKASIVRYSTVSFEDSGFECTYKPKEGDAYDLTKETGRIQLGLNLDLTRFIEVVKLFSTTENVTMTFDFGKTDHGFQTEYATFKSHTLKMRVKGSRVELFKILTDKVFDNQVYHAPNPIEFEITNDIIKNIISVSDIFKKPVEADNCMFFHTVKDEDGKHYLYVNDKEMSYNYRIGVGTYVDNPDTDWNDIMIPIYRKYFILAVRNSGDELKMFISSTETTRILIEGNGGSIKTAISCVKNAPQPVAVD